jgi:putative two-component system response regulator
MSKPPTVLMVDDEPTSRAALEALLYREGYQLAVASSGTEALSLAAALLPDLILLDVMMPDMDGYEVCRQLRAHPVLADVPIIIVTALDDRQSRLYGIEAGADDFISKPYDRVELRARVRTIMRLNRYGALHQAHAELLEAYNATLEGWAKALELHDNETAGHAQRVTAMTESLARALGVGEAELVHIRRGALLHDIGKIGVSDSILLKPGPLDATEWAIMRQHPVFAYELLKPIRYLHPALDIPHYHHERWDGSGYPLGLRGEQIPLAARIFAVVDVWDAMRSDRPYRKGLPEAEVRDYLWAQAGKLFDRQVVHAFLRLTVAAGDGKDPLAADRDQPSIA